MSFLADANAWLHATLADPLVAGVAVVYARPNTQQSVSLVVVAGRTVFRQAAPAEVEAAAVVWGERDYLIAVASLLLDGVVVLPRKGDQITEVIAGTALVFELFEAGGEPAWRYSDIERTLYRVHVKRIA